MSYYSHIIELIVFYDKTTLTSVYTCGSESQMPLASLIQELHWGHIGAILFLDLTLNRVLLDSQHKEQTSDTF